MIPVAWPLAQFGVWDRFWLFPHNQYALAGGAAIALLCGILSVFVVHKRMAFIGQGISHAAFGGVGVAVLAGVVATGLGAAAVGEELGQSPLRELVVAAFCVATAVVIGFLARRGKLSEDTAIGISLAGAMALGVLLLDVRRWYAASRGLPAWRVSIEDILFGSILTIQPVEVWAALALAVTVALLTAVLFKKLVFFTFDEEAAGVFGVRTTLLYYGLLIFLGLAIVAAMRTLGVILASALLIIPAASARYWVSRIGWLTLLSAAIAIVGTSGGFMLALWMEHLSPGPVIVLMLVAIFTVSYLFDAIRRASRRLGRGERS